VVPSERTSIATKVAIVVAIVNKYWINNLGGRTYTYTGTSWYKYPTSDSWSSIRQEDGYAQLQTIKIYVANSHH
jgi:hypothetical protein